MSAQPIGAGAGLLAAVGILLALSALRRGRIGLAHRLAPYVHRRARTSGLLRAAAPPEDLPLARTYPCRRQHPRCWTRYAALDQ